MNYTKIIIVLGSSNRKILEERVKKAVSLNSENTCYIMSGKGRNFLTEAVIMKNIATDLGICIDNIFTEEKSVNTRENIIFVNEMIKHDIFSKKIIVTSPSHVQRVKLLCDKYMTFDIKFVSTEEIPTQKEFEIEYKKCQMLL